MSRRLLLMWLAAFTVAFLDGDWLCLLALGVWGSSNKLFEVVYMLLWCARPINQVESLDFMGGGSNIQLTKFMVYELLTILLIVLAVIVRKRQISQ